MKRCKGEGVGICKTCWDTGSILTAHWKLSDLYQVVGQQGLYCYYHAKELEESVSKEKPMDRLLIVKRMNELKAELKALEKELPITEQRWLPMKGERYYFIDERWEVASAPWNDDSADTLNKVFYNCFKTHEAAEAEIDRLVGSRCLSEIADRLNQGKLFDWSDPNQKKYYLTFDWQDSEVVQEYATCSMAQGTVYCLCEDFYDTVIDEVDEKTLLNYIIN